MKRTGYLGYRNCADVLLILWMEDLLTHGEYSRIMDRLNNFFLKNEEK